MKATWILFGGPCAGSYQVETAWPPPERIRAVHDGNGYTAVLDLADDEPLIGEQLVDYEISRDGSPADCRSELSLPERPTRQPARDGMGGDIRMSESPNPCRYCGSDIAICDTPEEATGCPLNEPDDARVQRSIWSARCPHLLADRDRLVWALQRVYMWISSSALKEDEDTALTEARRICREALGLRC